jgi:hypothetical protein
MPDIWARASYLGASDSVSIAEIVPRVGRIDEWHSSFRKWFSENEIGIPWLPGCDGEDHSSLTG